LVTHGANAKELLLVTGLEKPPYVIPNQNSGFEIDLMRAVLSSLGHDITLLYVPYGRTYEVMKQIKADIGLTQSTKSGVNSEVLSLPYVTYQNVAVSLKENEIQISKIEELQKYTFVAFQHANKILGAEYSSAAKASPLYLELPEQRRQVELLFEGKVEVVVMEINIFKHFAKLIADSGKVESFSVHSIFPLTHYSAAIFAPDLREAYNRALTAYLATPEYAELLKAYDITYLQQTSMSK
jgi:polar amino acid transport system substrate-binding protein